MGKVKRTRQKFHAPASNTQTQNSENASASITNSPLLLNTTDNIFAGINISFDSLKKKLNDDVRSVASYKSCKSESGKHLTKKDKLKLRHEVLLHKIDALSQMKMKQKQRKKRKNNVIIGDTNALHDALPSLDSLLKSRDIKIKVNSTPTKKKGIAKATKRKKNMVQDIDIYKKLLSSKQLKKDPIKVIAEHVKQRVNAKEL